MSSQRVTLSVPRGLYEQLVRLVNLGYYESVAEAVRSGLRRELADAYANAPAAGLSSDDQMYLRRLAEIRRIIAGAQQPPKDKQEILDDLGRIRDQVWRERHPARP
jgi:Arc/MetJ-type ribon-helix-helix transcriptional regulator